MRMNRRLEKLKQHLEEPAYQAIPSNLTLQETMAAKSSSQITTHVLNTANGFPAAGVPIVMSKKVGESDTGFVWEKVAEMETNSDGRVTGGVPMQGATLKTGDTFEMHFDTTKYFAKENGKCFYPYVKIVFTIEDPGAHYHIPLLISPYGYSTYRGS